MGNIEIRDLSIQEADLAAEFFHEQWRANHVFSRNRELLLWQYRDNPCARLFSDGLTLRVALDGGPPVGVFAYMPFAFNRYGTKQYGCHLSAWWVHPDHRRGPLALRLLHSLQQHSAFDACLAGINTAAAERIYERMAWVVVRNIPRLVFVVDDNQFANLLDSGRPSPHAAPEPELRPMGLKLPQVESGIEISPMESFELLSGLPWDAFYWEKIAPAQMGPARELNYLHWRYGRIPIFSYDALLARSSKGISGLLVYRVERVMNRDEKLIRLVDLIAEPQAVRALVAALIRLAAEQRVAFIDFFCTYPTYLTQVRQCGFVDAVDSSGERYWCPYLFQPLDYARDKLNCSWWIRDADLQSSSAKSDFCIMKGDYEFDRPN